MHLHRSRRLTTAADSPAGAATSSAGILAAQRARQYLSGLVEAAIDRVFFEPLDVSTEAEALALLADREDGSRLRAAMLGASEWALARYARRKLLPRLGTKVAVWTGGKTAGKVILPITLSIEVTLASATACASCRCSAPSSMSRLRAEGLPVERDLVRRATTSLYLYPGRHPDLQRSGTQLARAVARRWLAAAVPGFGRRRARDTTARVRAVARLDLHQLVHAWRKAGARPAASWRTGPIGA